MIESVNTLVYKRTHRGDPDHSGVFGINDCMGKVRGLNFDAVIGVGGKRPDLGHEAIAGKINWIGIGREERGMGERGPRWSFEIFLLLNETGPDFKSLAPTLFKYMFEDHHVRLALSQNLSSEKMQSEVQAILCWAKESPQPEMSPRAVNKKNPIRSKCS